MFEDHVQIREIVAGISDTARCLWEKGWAERNAGNISVNVTGLLSEEDLMMFDRISPGPDRGSGLTIHDRLLIVTTAGSRMRDLARDPWNHLGFLKIENDGSPGPFLTGSRKQTGKGKVPTSELPTHLSIHEMLLKKKKETKAIVHTHATELIALTHLPEFQSAGSLNRLLWGMHPETRLFVPEGAGFIPYLLPGSTEIAEASAKELEEHPVVVWEKHGVIATGTTVAGAFDTIDLLSKSARIYFLVKSTGVEPEGLRDELMS